jgi:hypothetical protein
MTLMIDNGQRMVLVDDRWQEYYDIVNDWKFYLHKESCFSFSGNSSYLHTYEHHLTYDNFFFWIQGGKKKEK